MRPAVGAGKEKTRASRLGVTRRLDMSPSNARARERLEIDGDDERVNPFIIDRARVSDDDDDSRANATGPPKITATAPSPLLARLATFLPTMERANEALRGKSASEVCVETTTEDSDEARIEMVRETTRARRRNVGTFRYFFSFFLDELMIE